MQARVKVYEARKMPAGVMKTLRQKDKEKVITRLVMSLISVFTGPDVIYLQQEDDAAKNPNYKPDDEEDADEMN